MKNRIRMLKVKIKSLAAESVIIRKEERQTRGQERNLLCEHRRGIVRDEARHSQLAYGYLRGRSYAQVANGCQKPLDFSKVKGMVDRFGAVYDSQSESWDEFKIRQKAEQDGLKAWITQPTILAG